MKLTKVQLKIVLESLDLAIKYEHSIADAYGFKGIVADKALRQGNKFSRLRKKLKTELLSE